MTTACFDKKGGFARETVGPVRTAVSYLEAISKPRIGFEGPARLRDFGLIEK